MVRQPSLTPASAFRLEPVHQVHHGVEPPPCCVADQRTGNGDRKVRLARAGPAHQHHVVLIGKEIAHGEIAHQDLDDRRALEPEVVHVLRQRQLRRADLVWDRPRLLLGDPGTDEITDDLLRLVRAAMSMATLSPMHAMFVVYGMLDIAGLFADRTLPPRMAGADGTHHAPLGPSRAIVVKLAALFCIDSFAGGLEVQSPLALWLFQRFGLTLAEAGLFFFSATTLSAFSFPVAAWLARRIGLVNTMVFTHIPSSLALIAATMAGSVESALGLLLLRAVLSQMDVPTRTSYVMAMVTPADRKAAACDRPHDRCHGLRDAAVPALRRAEDAVGPRGALGNSQHPPA